MHISTYRLSAVTPEQMQCELQDIDDVTTANLAICFGSYQSISLLAQTAPTTSIARQWLAGSSCQGCADDLGLNTSLPYAATLMLIRDPEGHYGVGSAKLDADIEAQAGLALEMAMANAGKANELPQLIWCFQAPGQEEQVLKGFQNVVGTSVPIFGGSSADNDVTGNWVQFDGKQLYKNAVVVMVLYPSSGLSSYFSCGYSQVSALGKVSSVAKRELFEINDQPAAEVYSRAITVIGGQQLQPGNVLMESAFYPIGREIRHSEFPLYLLSHPAFITERQSLQLFSEVNQSEMLYLMHGERQQLIKRAADVAKTALQSLQFKYDCEASGALIVFCGGCMLAVKSELHLVQAAIKQELGDLPFVVTFTFGEQGSFIDGSNRHGNLMISAVVFGAADAQL